MKLMIKSLFWLLSLIIIIYIGIHVFLYFYQNKLLYYPSQETTEMTNKSWVEVYKDGTFLGYEHIEKKSKGKTVVIFHGNGGTAQNRTYYASIIPKNYNIFLAEYPGYGKNFAEPISMESLVDRSKIIMDYLIEKEKLSKSNYKNNISVLGESLGSGIASQIAQKYQIARLLLVIPYDSILNAAKMRYPWLWINPILRNNFDNVAVLKNYNGHVLVAVAEKDDVLDPSLAYNLYKSLPNGHKEELIVKNAHHLDCYNYLSKMDIQKIQLFLK